MAASRVAPAMLAVLVVLASLPAARPAFAADTITELPVGGLVFPADPALIVDAESVTITPDRVAVSYRLRNSRPTALPLPVTFPLPDIDLSDPDTDFDVPAPEQGDFMASLTAVDGRAVTLDVRQTALLDSRNVSQELRQAGLPLLALGAEADAFQSRLASLPEEKRRKLVSGGLVLEQGTDSAGKPIYAPGWTVKTVLSRAIEIPASGSVVIDHSYKASVGFSQDTVLRKALRTNKQLEPMVQGYLRDFCVEDDLLRGLDKVAGEAEANSARLRERRIWYAPRHDSARQSATGQFRLVIDKGKPDRWISTCATGFSKTSPTRFEAVRTGGGAAKDLRILLISRGED